MLNSAARNLWLLSIFLGAIAAAWLGDALMGVFDRVFVTTITAWIIGGCAAMVVWSFRQFRVTDSRVMCLLWAVTTAAVLAWVAVAGGAAPAT